MTPADAAAALRALVDRVRRNVPLNADPERFHLEKSEIARGLLDLADAIAPGSIRQGRVDGARPKPPVVAGRRRVTVTTEIIAGRVVAVQRRRMPFSVYVE